MERITPQPFEQPNPKEMGEADFEKPALVRLAEKIETADSEDEKKELINNFLDSFQETFHTKFSADVTALYNAMEEEKLLVRLEKLSAIMEDLLEHKPIHLGEAEKNHYANAVIPKNEGIKIAFSEGMAPGPIRLIMGFDVHSAIGFDPQGLEVSDIDTSEFDPRDTAMRSALCRHVEGDLTPEQIKYLIMRLPSHLVDEKYLTNKELENAPDFIFRGAKFESEKAVN